MDETFWLNRDEPMHSYAARIPVSAWAELEAAKQTSGHSINDLIVEAIFQYLAQRRGLAPQQGQETEK